MYIYIIIFFLIVIVLITFNKQNNTENFENCYLNVSNTAKNGDKTYFTNNMLDNYFDRKERISGLKNTDNNTVQTLINYKKNIFQSNDEFNKLNNEYNTFNNNIDQQFNKLNNNLTSKIQEAKTLKQSAINKFNTIDTNMSKLVGDSNSTLDEKLKPIVNSSINSNLDKISDNTINTINSTNMFNNRMTLAPSDINSWKIVPGYTAPMRIDPESGNVQCLSYDGNSCDWNYIQQNGNDISKIKTDSVKPVTCTSVDYNNANNWCKKLNDYYSQNNIDQVDWSNCPVGWTDVNKDGSLCQAPDNYSGSCSNVSTFSNYSPQDKQSWGQGCIARWPFKTNIINTVKNAGNIPSIINSDIDKKTGNITPTSLLDSFNTYSNGVYVQAYRLKSDNSRGDKIQDGIITTNINFNWGVGLIFGIRDNSTQTDTNMIYLELTGYLKMPGNATSITFRLSSDDGSRFIFSENEIKNMKVIIDMWQSQSVNSKESSSISVSPNTYLPFQIQFFENYGSASLKLEWAINGGSYNVIPRESFYVNKEICNYKFNFKYIKEIDTKAQSLIQSNNINPDIAIVKGISPTLISMNWSPYNFSSYANSNCSCSASYRLVYVYNNNILSSPSSVNSANNCPTYCNPSLTFNLDMSNIASINNISSLKLVLQFNNGNGVWVNSVCSPMQVSKGQTSYIFNCLTTQS
jgi:CPW-WPC domain-containing protein